MGALSILGGDETSTGFRHGTYPPSAGMETLLIATRHIAPEFALERQEECSSPGPALESRLPSSSVMANCCGSTGLVR